MGYILALLVGLGSLALYTAAFFFPEVHRKHDFLWSGVGLIYGVELWTHAGQVTGGLLLGEAASMALLGWLGWQTLKMRRTLTPLDQQTQLPDSVTSVADGIREVIDQLRTSLQDQSWQASLPEAWRTRLKQVAQFPEELKGWSAALFSTTFQAQSPSSFPPETPASGVGAQEHRVSITTLSQLTTKTIAAGLARASTWFAQLSDRLQEQAEHELTPQDNSMSAVAKAAEGNLSRAELAIAGNPERNLERRAAPNGESSVGLEWDDPETESHPELDTIDSAVPPNLERSAIPEANPSVEAEVVNEAEINREV